MAAPCALVVSCCSSVKSENLMKEIIGKEELPVGQPITDGIVGYPWVVNNKYYTANIQLCSTPQKTIGNQEFADSLEAIIIACSDEKSSFESVKQWLPFIQQLNPEIQILACEQFSKSKEISRDQVAVWCLDNSFELVELQLPEEDEEDQDEFDVIGTKRIISALHAHMWPNLEMKEERSFHHINLDSISKTEENSVAKTQNTDQTEDTNIKTVSDQTRTETDDKTVSSAQDTKDKSNDDETSNVRSCPDGGGDSRNSTEMDSSGAGASAGTEAKSQSENEKTSEDRIDALLGEDMKLFEALGSEDPGGESFEQLFSRMASMKAHAATLPEEDRKKYAEKVAIAFWRAMGGDEEEIDGLEDDSD